MRAPRPTRRSISRPRSASPSMISLPKSSGASPARLPASRVSASAACLSLTAAKSLGATSLPPATCSIVTGTNFCAATQSKRLLAPRCVRHFPAKPPHAPWGEQALLLRSYAVEALARPTVRAVASRENAGEFLRRLNGRETTETEPGVYRWSEIIEGHLAEIELEALQPKPMKLHRLLLHRTT